MAAGFAAASEIADKLVACRAAACGGREHFLEDGGGAAASETACRDGWARMSRIRP